MATLTETQVRNTSFSAAAQPFPATNVAAGDIVVVYADTGAAVTLTCTSPNLTFTLMGTIGSPAVYAWVAYAASALTAEVVTVTPSAQTQRFVGKLLLGQGYSSTPFVQAVTYSNGTGNSGSLNHTITMAAFGAAGNNALCITGMANANALNVTFEAAYTQFTGLVNSVAIQAGYLDGQDASIVFTTNDFFKTVNAIGIELEVDGGGVSLIVQSLSQSQTIDQPTLTQAHILASNDLTQAQAIDEPILTQANSLLSNDLDQAQAVDQPVLTQANALVSNDLDQAQSIDESSLTQASSLASDRLDQFQNIDQPALTQANILGANDLDQNQSIGSPVLTQAHILAVDDLTQSQTIDNVTLSVLGALSVDDLTQSQSIALANIIQHHILLVDGLNQSQSISIASMIQHYILAVDRLDQSQTIDQITLSTGLNINSDDLTQSQSLDIASLIQSNILSVDSLTQGQFISNVSDGSIVIGYHKGEISVFSAYNGIITSTNAQTGEVTVFNGVDIT